jgi:hypothetical protein
MVERRKYPRIPASVTLELHTLGSSVSRGRGCVVNLSLNGIAIDLKKA